MAKALHAYELKRDFRKTSEPAGNKGIRKAAYPRFVIQQHDATRLHYNLPLEVDGVFKSWAVTRGPSLDPREKRLAVEVEDHPLDYGDFEGTIPKGQYGGGTVMLWDRGFWSPDGVDSADEALANGELKFNMAGTKLKGSWVLVRMKHDRAGGKHVNWLLIKHRDEWAKAGDGENVLKDNDLSVASGRSMPQIAAGTGDGPTPFMTKCCKAREADAVLKNTEPLESNRKHRSPSPTAIPQRLVTVRAIGDSVLGVIISKRAKELWPQTADTAAVTKIQLAEYLASVGPWMIAHLCGRPCSLIRAPDGIRWQSFFQRHTVAGASDHVFSVKVLGDHEPYLVLNDVESLVAMGQLAALEFHPWNCAPDQPTVPGRLVFDLDPAPDVAFGPVIEAAKELRERLTSVGLVAFCKTTGGKGLHVVAPLEHTAKDTLDWDRAKMFAETVCAQMADDSPSRYLTNMSKKLRTGRIYLDYLRNDRIATAVAPLSPRARPRAPVSMPLNWNQVRAGLDPQRFTIWTAAKSLNASKAWCEYGSSAQPLRSAIEKLIGGNG
jgi:bifunctional non-homologous end joining protein LigD